MSGISIIKNGDSTNIYGGFWYHSNLFIPNPVNDSLIYLLTMVLQMIHMALLIYYQL
ncbi:MAG: hypothetical protein IPM91_09630 [Bacteroidetes bacterium]|nr:hypothetical protein [Bacteroidota bacterium]